MNYETSLIEEKGETRGFGRLLGVKGVWHRVALRGVVWCGVVQCRIGGEMIRDRRPEEKFWASLTLVHTHLC